MAKAAQEILQAEMDNLVGDTIILKLHDGPPGPDFTDNLMFGDGRPQEYTYSKGGAVTWKMPEVTDRVPAPRRWWHLRRRYMDVPKVWWVEWVTAWSDGRPVMPVDWRGRVHLRGGDTLTLRDIKRPVIL